jgi:phosphoribosylformimino-5-aminoimidazole carboxamide ribotide isomerase
VVERSTARVVAAGGVGSLDHVRAVLAIAHPRLEGVVIGRALYEGAVDLKEALLLARKEFP